MRIINKDTVWRFGEAIDLKGEEVQIAPGATLTIESGAKVTGGTLTVYGELRSTGSPKSKTEFNNVNFLFGSDHDTPGRIDLSHARVNGGSFLDATGNGSYGSFNLTDNEFRGVSGFYIWYPTSASLIVRNVFVDTQGLSVGTDIAAPVTVQNNVFVGTLTPYNGSSNAAIVSWASYGGPDALAITNNTFLVAAGATALEVADGYDTTGMSVNQNFYYTIDQKELERLFLDREDSLSRSFDIEDLAPLLISHQLTPQFKMPAINGTASAERLFGTHADDEINGLGGNDRMEGGLGNDTLSGGGGDDVLKGGAGNDQIRGSAGRDQLDGGLGKDTLFGGNGADTFLFRKPVESPRGASRDVIEDFDRGADKIDVRSLDANSGVSGDQSFTYIRGKAFSEVAGELQFKRGVVSADVNGDGVADLMVELADVSTLGASDFLL